MRNETQRNDLGNRSIVSVSTLQELVSIISSKFIHSFLALPKGFPVTFSFFLLMSGESIGVIRLTAGRNLLERLLLAFSIHEPFIFLALPKGFPVTFSIFYS